MIINSRLIIYHLIQYIIEKNENAKSNRKETRKFLKSNHIKLNTRYYQADKPVEELIGYSSGLSRYYYATEEVDSTFLYPIEKINQINAFYSDLKSDSLKLNNIIYAGDYSYFNLYLIRNKSFYSLINEKMIKGWYDFEITE